MPQRFNSGSAGSVIGITALAFVLAACSPVTRGDGGLYKYDRGPHEVQIVEKLTMTDEVQDREVPLRLLFPAEDGPFPLVVFSSGAFCFPQMYDLVTSHWVSHGYVVIVPNHLDSPNNAAPPTAEQFPLMFPSRVRDISYVVDDIEEIQARAGIGSKIDITRLAAAGHSFGAIIALIKTGLELQPELADTWASTFDDRFDAAVVLSAPGPGMGPGMDSLTDGAYTKIGKPLIATGGTNDVGRVRPPGGMSPGEWRTLAFTLAPPGDKYSVITEGTDHYSGGLICNPDRGGDPDPESVAIVASVTTAFLDAYIKDDDTALEFLQNADVEALTNGKATGKRK
jgi:pimeloyl-ACP methyl ester carboxylesterase